MEIAFILLQAHDYWQKSQLDYIASYTEWATTT